MIKTYLEKIRNGFEEEKYSIVEQINSCNNQLKENKKFIEMLEDTNDPNYEAFTPRETNSFNKNKISELQEEQKAVIEQLSNLQDQLGEIEYKIEEISSIIRVVKEDTNGIPKIDNDNKDTYESRIAVLQTVEADRQRIARELHDSTTQNLTALVHKIELCTKLLDVDPVRCKLELFTVGKTLREIIEDTRNLIYYLRPMSFDDMGFDITIERALEKFNQSNNVLCQYHVEGEPYAIDSVLQITLLRVIQEACNNVIKHAEASKVDVTLLYEQNKIILSIKDDGIGFDTDKISEISRKDNSGFGLSMMKERVYLLSGKLEIQSSPQNGCTILATIPTSKEA